MGTSKRYQLCRVQVRLATRRPEAPVFPLDRDILLLALSFQRESRVGWLASRFP